MRRDAAQWRWWLGATVALTFWPQAATAIQTHGHPEGLYAHQLGHFFFLATMVYLCWQFWRQNLLRRRSFHRIYWACLLFADWNLLTFLGHMAEERLDAAAIDSTAGHLFRQLHITDLNALIFYLAKLDHIILIPALWFFYLGLRAFRTEQREGIGR